MDDKFIKLALDAGLLNYIDHETPKHYFINGHADLENVAKFAELVILETHQEAADEIKRLRGALREIYEVYAGSEGIPQPLTAAEGYLLSLFMETVRIAQESMKEGK